MTRTTKIDGGKLYITYQGNDCVRYYAVYDDGTTEYWYEKEEG